MDRSDYSHTHNFTSDLYEEEHPHKMYAQCSCNARYYLGWNATVSYCTTCNPPVSDVPIVTAVADETAINLSWTTVYDALEYQVWRARSLTGTYFNIYTALGSKMSNKSVTIGETYYYKVVAVLEKDSNGNPTKTASSTVVSCTMGGEPTPIPLGTPVITGQLDGTEAVISWQAISGADKYEVWHATSENGTYTKLTTTTELIFTNSPNPGTYFYKVRAIGADDTAGEFSNIVHVTIPLGTPVITGQPNGTKAVISWKAISGADKYEVWRATSENGTYTRLIATTKLTCTNTPKPGTYFYKVRAIGTDGKVGTFSNIVRITIP
jgi:fibronectin type 3 domain-containing protein